MSLCVEAPVGSNEFFTHESLAKRWDCSRATIYNLERDDPSFPAKVRLGPRVVRFRRSDVERYESLKAEVGAA
jgi:predicted DNA-binding transcriptional regulator AlpA